MPQITSSEDVYRELVEKAEEDWLYGLVAFAIVEEQRIEWMKHHEQHNGAVPTSDDIRDWYLRQPENVLLRAKGTAENALQLYADDVLQAVLETERREVADGVIVGEIRSARRLWPQFGINVAGGLVSAILFTAILIILAFAVFSDFSPVSLTKDAMNQQSKEETNGYTESKPGSD